MQQKIEKLEGTSYMNGLKKALKPEKMAKIE
jgi:hypothetical protein